MGMDDKKDWDKKDDKKDDKDDHKKDHKSDKDHPCWPMCREGECKAKCSKQMDKPDAWCQEFCGGCIQCVKDHSHKDDKKDHKDDKKDDKLFYKGGPGGKGKGGDDDDDKDGNPCAEFCGHNGDEDWCEDNCKEGCKDCDKEGCPDTCSQECQ